jgi:hypothetical protein
MYSGIGTVVMASHPQHEDRTAIAAFQQVDTDQREVGLDPGAHDGQRYWLDDVINGASGKARCFIAHFRHAGDKNYRDMLCFRIIFQGTADRIAVHVRHLDIKQDQRWYMFFRGD